MSFLGFLGRKRPDVRAVIDVGSHSIKTAVFELASSGKVPLRPKIIKKTVLKLSSTPDPAREVSQLREILFSTLKELGRVPSAITIALGPYLAEQSLETWGVDGKLAGRKSISRRELGIYFQNLFEQKRDPRRALIAYPLDLLLNEYSASHFLKTKEKVAPVGTVSFRTMLLYFSKNIGEALKTAKQDLGGLPIEFIPLPAVYQESIPRSLRVRDAFLIDIGGEETTLTFLKDGAVEQVASFAIGAHNFVRGTAEALSISFEEAEDLKRQGAQGMADVGKKSKLSLFLKEEAARWEKMFRVGLDVFYMSGPLPSKVLLLGGGAYLTEIADALRKPDWIRDFSYASSPEVLILRAENFFEGDTLGGFLAGPEDAGIASLMVYSMRHVPLFG